MSELKSCPFCGGEAETKMYRWGEKQDGEAIWCYYIFCTNCQSMSDNLFTDKDCAIAAWNTRTASPRFTAEENMSLSILIANLRCDESGDNCENCPLSYDDGDCLRSMYTVEKFEKATEDATATVRKMLEVEKC